MEGEEVILAAQLPDEDVRSMLDNAGDIDLLFPMTTTILVHVAAEYAHRFGHAHARTRTISRAARPFGPQDARAYFDRDNVNLTDTIARWRAQGVTWTKRRPPPYVPRDEVLHAPTPGTEYTWDNVGHETYRYRYRVVRAAADAVILKNLDSRAMVAPTWDRFNAEYVPVGGVEKQYVFGATPCGWYRWTRELVEYYGLSAALLQAA